MPVNQDRTTDVSEREQNYRAFLLRCWQEPKAGQAGEPAWRFTLVQIGNGGNKKGFGCLEDVMAYLSETLEAENKNNTLK